MKYLILYDNKNAKTRLPTDWSLQYADFDFKKQSFKNAPLFTQDDGDVVIDIKWLLQKVDTTKYDGVIASLNGNKLKTVWGTHNRLFLGNKRFSVLQSEFREDRNFFWRKTGLLWELISKQGASNMPQPETTFDHELYHSLCFLHNTRDTLHMHIRFKRLNHLMANPTFPKKQKVVAPIEEEKYKALKPNPLIASIRPVSMLPRVKRLSKEFVRLAKEQGLPVRITSGIRTFKEQAQLYAQGRTTSGRIVTNTRAGESFHNYGVAFDIYPLAGWDIPQSDWEKLGEIGESLGLEWGGRWEGFVDRPHFQLPLDYSIRDFQEGSVDYLRYK